MLNEIPFPAIFCFRIDLLWNFLGVFRDAFSKNMTPVKIGPTVMGANSISHSNFDAIFWSYFANKVSIPIPWVVPLPNNNDHQDYFMFSRGFL